MRRAGSADKSSLEAAAPVEGRGDANFKCETVLTLDAVQCHLCLYSLSE